MKSFFTIVFLLSSFTVYAKNVGGLHCHTLNHEKEFDLYQNKIAFYQDKVSEKNVERRVASMQLLRSGKTDNLFKIFKYEGDIYTVEVKNLNALDWATDYLSIRSAKGHEITYPLKCELL